MRYLFRLKKKESLDQARKKPKRPIEKIAKKIGDRKATIEIGIADHFSNGDRYRDRDRNFGKDRDRDRDLNVVDRTHALVKLLWKYKSTKKPGLLGCIFKLLKPFNFAWQQKVTEQKPVQNQNIIIKPM